MAEGEDALHRQRPGESKHANIGISLPGTFENPVASVYIGGKPSTILRGGRIVADSRHPRQLRRPHYGQLAPVESLDVVLA